MTSDETARREEWNRIVAWLKGPDTRFVTTPRQREVNRRTFGLLRALRGTRRGGALCGT